MKTFKNIYGILVAFLAIAAVSCSESVEYTPATPAAVDATEYFFTPGTETNIVISPSDKQIVATLNRLNAEKEATIKLNVVNNNEELFAVPTEVKFAAGETSADVVIEVSDSLVFFETYEFSFSIAEEYTNPYIAENNNPKLHYVVMRNDYAPFATGVYSSWFWEQEWDAVLEYSPSLDLFRFKDCWVAGYDVTFTCDTETMEFTMAAGQFASGYVHPSYGMVTAQVLADYNYYDPATDTFYFAYKWVVSAGSFGSGFDSFTITELH